MDTTEQIYQSQSQNRNQTRLKSTVLCSFYTRIGACRHGEKCTKKHLRPTSTKTILIPNLYQNPRFDLEEYLKPNKKHHLAKKRKTENKKDGEADAKIKHEPRDDVKDNEEVIAVDEDNKKLNEIKKKISEALIDKDKEKDIEGESKITQQDKHDESSKEEQSELEKEELAHQDTTPEVPNHSQEKTCINQEKHSHDESHPVLTDEQIRKDFDLFYQDIFVHIAKLGQINDMAVCENENHLSGHVYVKFNDYEDAYNANLQLNQEWYNGRPIYSELSPVNSISDAHCLAWDHGHCNRGATCNYLHVKQPTQGMKKSLYDSQSKSYTLKRLEMLKKQVPGEIISGAGSNMANGNEVNVNNISIRSTTAFLEHLF